jgi:2-phosphosulfolactate phosphatase
VTEFPVKLFFYHTPELVPNPVTPDCAIVIDVLRATTTIAAALHAGAEAVQAFKDLDELMQASDAWPVERRLRAGERGGKMVEGCDLGNSPLDCTVDRFADRRLFISTTNGTRALNCVQSAPVVLTAALVNRQSVVHYLQTNQPETVWIVGSGWEGSYSLEDSVCAGAIVAALAKNTALEAIVGNDETIAALALFQQWEHNLLGLLEKASHGQRLLGLNNTEDLKFCAQLDTLEILPQQREPGILAKTV